jgi:SAM-dependent methyltransferase
VSDFPVDWLTAREPYDHAARSAPLAERFGAALGANPRVLDLGCGTGSNLRYLAPRIAGPHWWRCVDNEPALLRAAPQALHRWACDRGWAAHRDGEDLVLARPAGEIAVTFALGDLACQGLGDGADFAGVTGSALLDLTSAAWLDSLAEACSGRPLLMALSFDGRLAFEPAAPEDEEVCRQFRAHQRTDKGFGAALGPEAAAYLGQRLTARGCAVAMEGSDWSLGPSDGALLRATLDGIIVAVREVAPDRRPGRWAARRRAQLEGGDLRLTVGHVDLLAVPG